MWVSAPLVLIAAAAIVFYNNREAFRADGPPGPKCGAVVRRKNAVVALLCAVPLAEAAFLVSCLYYQHGVPYAVKLLCVCEWLIPVAYMDYKKRIIPNALIAAGLGLFAVFLALDVLVWRYDALDVLKAAGGGLLLGAGVFVLCLLVTKGGMGMGDVKLFGVLGLLLGWDGVFYVILHSVVLVAGYGLVMMARKKLDRKATLPIGPFALLSMLVSVFLGL
ncbi:MAG: A24 family peptidase [Oscillospiraceae bacterium]|jgi:Flp pilus assembly protein protease CpaA|nr:A24 family peptidase [Oscillospiraceae bacterium]